MYHVYCNLATRSRLLTLTAACVGRDRSQLSLDVLTTLRLRRPRPLSRRVFSICWCVDFRGRFNSVNEFTRRIIPTKASIKEEAFYLGGYKET